MSLGRPTDGEGMLHILVHIYIANVNFASQESRIIHFALCQVTCRCNKWSGWIPAAGDAACVALREPNQRSKKLKKSVDAMDIYLNSNCRDQQRRERDHINI